MIFLNKVSAEEFSPVNYIPQNFDVIKYNVSLNLQDYPKKDAQGTCLATVKLLDKANNPEYKFSLRGLTIDSIMFIKSDFPYTLDKIGTESDNNYHFVIKPKAPYDAKDIPDTINIFIKYHGQMTNEGGQMDWGGVSIYGTNIFSMGVGFYNNYVSCGQHWFPCYDQPSDKAEFEFWFTTNPEYKIASNGTCKEFIAQDANLFHFEHKFPTSTYLVNFAMDKFVIDTIPNSYNEIPIVVYTQQSRKKASDSIFCIIPNALKIYENAFGKYPFEIIGYCLTAIGSMEHQTMISYDYNLATYPPTSSAKNVAVHEFAHQWFGDAISPLDFRDAWLNESFATYSESIYHEFANNYMAYLNKQRSDLSTYLGMSNSEGIVSIYDFPREKVGNYPGTIYYKGSVVIGMLRFELGDSLFFGFLKSYNQKYKYSNISTAKFLEELQNFTKKDLTQFFDKWIYKPGFPVLESEWKYIDRDKNNNYSKIQLSIKQIQQDIYPIYKNLPIELKFNVDSKYNKIIYLNQKEEVFEIDSLPYSVYVSFNQGEKLITLLKLNSNKFVDVEENQNLSDFITPNPASDYIILKSVISNEVRNPEIEIFNIFGEKTTLSNLSGLPPILAKEGIFRIDISNLVPGVYFVKIGDKFEKFVKM
jgi:aminopeptidase N